MIVRELRAGCLSEYIHRGLALFPRKSINVDDLEALVFLEWYSFRSRPTCYLEFGIRRGYASAVVAAANPGVEIYGFDEWQGVPSGESDDTEITNVPETLRVRLGYRAYARYINGSLGTAVSRLRKSFVGPFCPDLVLVRGELVGESFRAQVADLLNDIAPGGAVIVTSAQAGELPSFWKEWKKASKHGVLFLSKSGRAGMILSDERLAAAVNGLCTVDCDFDVALLSEVVAAPSLRRSISRLLKALSQPRRYPEFFIRVLLWLIRQRWPHLMVSQ
jgi:hypothetical protein